MERYLDDLINDTVNTIDDMDIIAYHDKRGTLADSYFKLGEQFDELCLELAQYPSLEKDLDIAHIQAFEIARYLDWGNNFNLGCDGIEATTSFLIDGFMTDDPKFKQDVINTITNAYADDLHLIAVVKEFALNKEVKVVKLF